MTGGSAEQVLASFAGRFGGDKASDFEGLLGPLDDVSSALQELRGLLDITSESQASVAQSLRASASFVRMLYRIGFGTALDMISLRARAEQNIAFATVVRRTCFALQVALRGEDDWVTVGTLNYDGLIHAGFLDVVSSSQIADLASGIGLSTKYPDRVTACAARSLRRTEDLPNRPIEILNLHGSLSWLQDDQTGDAWKFNLSDLRNMDYWELLKRNESDLQPVVVLTNRKSETVLRWPFSLAYRIFARRMVYCDRWVIIGYAFGDEPVNHSLRSAWNEIVKSDRAIPKLLVITKTDTPTQFRNMVGQRLGIPPANIAVDGGGISNSLGGPAWQSWAA